MDAKANRLAEASKSPYAEISMSRIDPPFYPLEAGQSLLFRHLRLTADYTGLVKYEGQFGYTT